MITPPSIAPPRSPEHRRDPPPRFIAQLMSSSHPTSVSHTRLKIAKTRPSHRLAFDTATADLKSLRRREVAGDA
jgi:hypothetical protein